MREEAERLAEQERLRLLMEPPDSLTGAVLDLPPRLTTDPAPLKSPSETARATIVSTAGFNGKRYTARTVE